MRERNLKALWEELVQAFHGWMDQHDDDDEGEQAQDPSLVFHLLFTAPLLLGLFAMMTRRA
jgi:hypothetical protein